MERKNSMTNTLTDQIFDILGVDGSTGFKKEHKQIEKLLETKTKYSKCCGAEWITCEGITMCGKCHLVKKYTQPQTKKVPVLPKTEERKENCGCSNTCPYGCRCSCHKTPSTPVLPKTEEHTAYHFRCSVCYPVRPEEIELMEKEWFLGTPMSERDEFVARRLEKHFDKIQELIKAYNLLIKK